MTALEAQWLRLSEETNALDYLRRTVRFVREAESDVTAWKWVIISLHGALYGFAVAAARGTDHERVLNKKGRLLGFWDVLKRCQDPTYMRMLVNSKPLVLSVEEKESLDFLTRELRNEFIHFRPNLWSLEIHGMPQIALDALRVIGFLALETNTFVHLNEAQEREVETLVQETSTFVKGTALYAELLQAKDACRRAL